MSIMPHSDWFHDCWSLPAVRERIISDFRDFHFTWAGFFKWSAVTLLAILFAALVTLYFLDWNQMRGPIGRYLSHRTGREVRIDGDLSVKLFSWQPSIDAAGLTIGNPQWAKTLASKPQAATVSRFQLEFRWMPLFRGHLVLPLVR